MPNIKSDELAEDDVEFLPHIDGINQSLGLSYVGGDVDFYKKLLRQFSKKHGPLSLQIRKDINNQNIEVAERNAHTIKGVSATLGAETLAQISMELEVSLRKRKLIGIDQTLCYFEEEFSKINKQLIRIFEEEDDEIVPEENNYQSLLSEDQALVILEDLSELLAEGNSKAYKSLDEIRGYLESGGYQSQLDKITTSMDDVEFEMAHEHVLHIISDLTSVVET
ncbi:MAG: Hpt domain-containing protein [Pseudomonadales bacterium]|nr:Hpt domain-containing protein [Pseudomonadales bacterium]